MQSTLSTPSMMSKMRPPPGGLAATTHEVTIALVPSGDFGEITDNAAACGGRERWISCLVAGMPDRLESQDL
jgi:hypothetical protein